jgi:hypothetical protein
MPHVAFPILARRRNPARASGMNARLKKFIGSLALIAFSLVYYWFVISVAIARLPGLAMPWHLLFYFLAVVVWFGPSALIIRWLQR